MFVPCFVVHCYVSFLVLCIAMCPYLFCNHLDGEKRAGCLTYFVFLVSRDCYSSVALPHGAVGWSVVCDCGISRSYSLAFLNP